MQYFRTPKGTEIPLIDLKGKKYLVVAERLRWFREEHPDWSIVTHIVQSSDTHSVVKAEIFAPGFNWPVATAHKREDAKHFQDHLEKAETGAVGRALAMCGYGTQFAPELDEGDRIVDSPVPPRKTSIADLLSRDGPQFSNVFPYGQYAGKRINDLSEKTIGAYYLKLIQLQDTGTTNPEVEALIDFVRIHLINYPLEHRHRFLAETGIDIGAL